MDEFSSIKAKKLVCIDNGNDFDFYETWIDNGTEWEQYETYIDNGSSWDLYGGKAFVYLYDNGDECIDITGGWEKRQTAAGSITKNADHVSFSLMGIPTYNSYGVLDTVNAIDLTDVDELTINPDWIVKEDNGVYRPIFGVAKTKPRSADDMRKGSAMTQEDTLDVSALSGDYYIYVGSPMIPENQYDVELKVTEIMMS